ncbi:hypothetical protein IV203_027919 [Nitzschia inconspicua]|uniref:Uncharacterized protein n=1 Tax=Nitzschia inconspicua TaxID=303405 RepID=A0A9K3LY59_9STRA|nr:hypothetical protein IV203_027919 [Nitzschia inconspicua]
MRKMMPQEEWWILLRSQHVEHGLQSTLQRLKVSPLQLLESIYDRSGCQNLTDRGQNYVKDLHPKTVCPHCQRRSSRLKIRTIAWNGLNAHGIPTKAVEGRGTHLESMEKLMATDEYVEDEALVPTNFGK